jgi:hypothetical protein
MTNFEVGCGAVLGLAFVIWVIWVEVRMKQLAAATLLAMEKLKDEKIVDRVKAFSDAELDALLAQDIQSRHKN